MKKTFSSLLFLSLVLSFSFALAFFTGDISSGIDFWSSITLKSWCIIFGIQIVIFLPSFILKTEHYFDLTGGLTFLLVLIFLAYNLITKNELFSYSKLIPLVLVGIWALRLSTFLFLRVKRKGKDIRFDEIKINFFKFMIAWILQGLWVFICLLPVIVMVSSNQPTNINYFIPGVLLWLIGWLTEVISDIQKTKFNTNIENKGNFISSGLWSFSRHPNYFGELILWLGVTIIAIPTFSGLQYLACIAPVFVYLLLNKISGVNLLEEIADNRWGDSQKYQDYKKNTPIFFPRIFKN